MSGGQRRNVNASKGVQGFHRTANPAPPPPPTPAPHTNTPVGAAPPTGDSDANVNPDYDTLHQRFAGMIPETRSPRCSDATTESGARVWVETIWGEEEIDVSTVSDKVREVYATGQCWSLAREIAARIPDGRVGIVFAHHIDLPEDWEPQWGVEMDDVPQLREDTDWLESARHVVAVDRYGWAYDVNGQHDSGALREMSADVWDADNMVVVEVPEYSTMLRNDLYRFAPEQNDEAAARVADLLHPR